MRSLIIQDQHLFNILDLLGIAVFAVSGALAGSAAGLDEFGMTVLAAVTAIGGGTLRDLLLNRHPIFWIVSQRYLVVVLVSTALTIIGIAYLPRIGHPLLLADAIGLGLFALAGAQIAEAQGCNWLVVVLMGTMTGVAGGVIRDVLSGVVPLILRRDIYATAAIAGICWYLLWQRIGWGRKWGFLTGIVVVVVIRLLAIYYGWQLPHVEKG